MAIANVALMWLFVDIFKFPTVVSSTIIVSFFFREVSFVLCRGIGEKGVIAECPPQPSPAWPPSPWKEVAD